MKTKDVRIDAKLNKAVWARGRRNPCRRVRVRMYRRRNEDEESEEQFYTVMTLVSEAKFPKDPKEQSNKVGADED